MRAKTYAVLSKYQGVKIKKETGFIDQRHGNDQGKDVFNVYLVGPEDKMISVFLKYEEAKSYAEKLSSVTSLHFVLEVEE